MARITNTRQDYPEKLLTFSKFSPDFLKGLLFPQLKVRPALSQLLPRPSDPKFPEDPPFNFWHDQGLEFIRVEIWPVFPVIILLPEDLDHLHHLLECHVGCFISARCASVSVGWGRHVGVLGCCCHLVDAGSRREKGREKTKKNVRGVETGGASRMRVYKGIPREWRRRSESVEGDGTIDRVIRWYVTFYLNFEFGG